MEAGAEPRHLWEADGGLRGCSPRQNGGARRPATGKRGSVGVTGRRAGCEARDRRGSLEGSGRRSFVKGGRGCRSSASGFGGGRRCLASAGDVAGGGGWAGKGARGVRAARPLPPLPPAPARRDPVTPPPPPSCYSGSSQHKMPPVPGSRFFTAQGTLGKGARALSR